MVFQNGETVICKCEVKDSDGNYYDPTTAMRITIVHELNGVEVEEALMVKDDVGKYHYDHLIEANGIHRVKVEFIAIDGSRITREENSFMVE